MYGSPIDSNLLVGSGSPVRWTMDGSRSGWDLGGKRIDLGGFGERQSLMGWEARVNSPSFPSNGIETAPDYRVHDKYARVQ
ncbi:hypothetical protein FNAPI_11530 [Fusarium napiforme]|uniref:Uncharacterized protein n=1 Tax=Fusarium napiforme TaxID=42672 RepID=A0A8H5MQE2_9HYPO|nr:hypothetical protein FNAPI_11530 [Fusarium napiforme]